MSKSHKAFAVGVLIAALGAILAEVGRDAYRKWRAN